MKLLEGKKILVTGVANDRSIAWGIAKALHEHGAELAFTCMEGSVRRLKKLLPQANISTDLIFPCNVQNDAEIDALFAALSERWDGEMHGMVHSIAYARYEELEGEFITTTREGFALAHDVSAYSLVALARGARPLLKKAGASSIITLTFNASNRVIPHYNVMAPAKAALESSAIYLAYDLGKDGIRVNMISAGVLNTASAAAISGLKVALNILEKFSPIGRNITIDDVGGPAVFLMSDLSKAVTGTLLFVDGGANILAGASDNI